jgi:hypothetical protein
VMNGMDVPMRVDVNVVHMTVQINYGETYIGLRIGYVTF